MDKKTLEISASEINRFLYCNYQWYYEKKYGIAKLKSLKREFLEDIGADLDPSKSHLAGGRILHAKFERHLQIGIISCWLRFAMALGIFLYVLGCFPMVVI